MTIKSLEMLSQWYAVTPEYVSAVAELYGVKRLQDYSDSVRSLLDGLGDQAVQFEYALSTNARGRELVSKLEPFGVLHKKNASIRHLDIGCAYGGFNVAFAEKGCLSTGLDINDDLILLAHLNTKNFPVKIVNDDFLKTDYFKKNNQFFDVITCNDVIEHVEYPRMLIEKASDILVPGGYFYLETVNRLSIRNVWSDIHFQLFGLNLLPRTAAAAAYGQYTKNAEYGVAEFYERSYYVNTLNSCGFELISEFVDSTVDYKIEEEMLILIEKFREWKCERSFVLDPYLREEITLQYFSFLGRFCAAYRDAINSGMIVEFGGAHVDPVLKILARKKNA